MTALAQTWRKVTRRGGTAQTTEASEERARRLTRNLIGQRNAPVKRRL